MKITIPEHPDNDERSLVAGCQRNTPSAQKEVYNRYCDMLLLVCLRYTGNEEDAKEALMDSFLDAFRGIGSFRYTDEGSLGAWLRKIAVNRCLARLRRQKATTRELVPADETQFADTGQADVLAQMSSRELLQLIRGLPPGYKAVFNLYVFEEMSHKEIAALLQISEQTSKSQLHRARALLQQQIIVQQKTGL
jgi:RNA polymerase sigma-70 factor, ECF subfamily